MSGNVLVVLDKQPKVGAGSTIAMNGDSIGGFSVSVSGAGNVSARVRLEIANDPGGPWVSDAASIVSLSGICSATTYLRSTTHFEYIRAVVESISAGAVVSVFFGDFASSGTGFYQQDNLVFGETKPLTGRIKNLQNPDGSDCFGDQLDFRGKVAGTVMVDWSGVTIDAPTAGWTVTKDTSKTWGGFTSLKVSALAGAADTMTCDITVPAVFLGGAKRIAFAVAPGDSYITGDGANYVQLWLNYSASTTHRVLGFVGAAHAPGEWSDSGALFDQDASGTGHILSTVQWAKVAVEEVTTIRLVMTKRAGQALGQCNIGPMVTDPIRDRKATISLFMDGQYSGQYKYARQLLQAYGFRASMALVVPWIGSRAGTMSEAEVLKMEDLGHELIGHTGTAGDYGWDSTTKYPDGSEYALVKADATAAFDWMRARNRTRGIGYGVVSFTNGMVNTQTLARRQNIAQALRDAGMKKVRQLGGYSGSYYGNAREGQLFLPISRLVTSADLTATITGIIDQIESRGGWSGLSFHDFVLSGATGNNVNVDVLEAILDYLAAREKAGGVRVVPFAESMKEMDGIPLPA